MPKGSNYEIKTTIAIDGEKAFKAAMDDVNRSMRVSDSELKKLQASFDAGGSEMDYFTGRARILNREHEQQQEKVKALQKAVEEAAEMYGYASVQVQGYKIQLNNAEIKEIQLAKAAKEANRDLEAFGRDSNKIGRQIERGIGDAAEDAGEKLDSMFERVQKDVNALKSSVAVQVGLELGSKVFDALQGVVDFVEESREYRRLQSFAQQSAIRNNLDIAEIERYANEIAVFFGDYDAAVETVAVLTEAGFKGETLGMAVDNLIGAAIAYYNTLNTESLAESIQETIATGELTGQYAELVDRLQGITMITAEDLEKELKAAKTQEEKLELLMAPLTEAGMQSNKFDYEARNAELLKAAEAERALQEAWANLAAEIEPIVTAIVNKVTTLVDGVTDIIKKIKDFEWPNWDDLWPDWDNVDWPDWEDIKTQTDELNKAITERLSKIFGFPIGAGDGSGVTAPSSYQSFIDAVKNGELNSFGGTLDYFIKNLIPSAGAETLPGGDANEAGFQTMQEYVKGMQDAANAEVSAAQAAVATTIAQMQTEEQLEAAFEAGRNAMIAFGNGIAEAAPIPINNVRDMVNTINAMLAQIATPAYGLGWSGISGGNIYLYNQQRNNARNVSKMIGSGVISTTLSKK